MTEAHRLADAVTDVLVAAMADAVRAQAVDTDFMLRLAADSGSRRVAAAARRYLAVFA